MGMRSRSSRFYDQLRNLLRMGFEYRVTGSWYFNCVAAGSFGIHPLQVGVDDPVGLCYHIPARFHPPGGDCNNEMKYCVSRKHLGMRHKLGLFFWNVCAKICMKTGWFDIVEIFCRFLQRLVGRRVQLSIAGFCLPLVWRMRRDVYESCDMRIIASFGNKGSGIAMTDQNAGSVLPLKDR